MTALQIVLVQDSFAALAKNADATADVFYSKLFTADPSLRPMFRGDLKEQARKLMRMIGVAVAGLNRLETIVPVVEDLGRRHAGYGVRDSHYDLVGETLIATLAEALGPKFTAEVQEAWAAAYGVLASTMMRAANEQRRYAAIAS
jgi:hemoglobin-like flavoprotein